MSLCQTPDTLTIQSEVTDDYKSYLNAKEAGWEAKLLEEGGDDTSAKMNAHMGLALIQFARAQVDGDVPCPPKVVPSVKLVFVQTERNKEYDT